MRINLSKLLQFVALFWGVASCTLKADSEMQQQTKINGLSYAAASVLLDSVDVHAMKQVGATWVALTPYGFLRQDEHRIRFNSDRQWISETTKGIAQDIVLAHRANLKIMLKPHVWISHGDYTGDFELNNTEDWEVLEESYRNYLLTFAKVAQTQKVELFCIGTEWRKFIKARPVFWHSLIQEIRTVYKGKLTYAANWDEYTETPFWSELDYVGVNAYFPLTEKINPSVEELAIAWQPTVNHLKGLSENVNRPILFTEYGYRSVEGTTIKPWESYTEGRASMSEQEIALEALYKSNWGEPWFAGGFLWKWFNGHSKRGGIMNADYTPQNKPAIVIIKNNYEASQ